MAVDLKSLGSDPATRQIILESARKAGLYWGGSFNPPDYTHFDLRPEPADRSTLIDNFTDQVNTLINSRK